MINMCTYCFYLRIKVQNKILKINEKIPQHGIHISLIYTSTFGLLLLHNNE